MIPPLLLSEISGFYLFSVTVHACLHPTWSDTQIVDFVMTLYKLLTETRIKGVSFSLASSLDKLEGQVDMVENDERGWEYRAEFVVDDQLVSLEFPDFSRVGVVFSKCCTVTKN